MNLPCPHTEKVSAWLDGALLPEEASPLEEHVRACSVCQEERASLERLSELFTVLKEVSPAVRPFDGWATGTYADALVATVYSFRRVLSIAALVLVGIGALIALAPDLSRDELRFEAYLEQSLDQDVFEMTSLAEDDFSRDRVVGLLISSTY